MCGPDDHLANADTERQYRTQPSLKPERRRVATASGRLSASCAHGSSDSGVADLPRVAASSVPDGALVVEPLALTFDGYTCECLHLSSDCMTPEAPCKLLCQFVDRILCVLRSLVYAYGAVHEQSRQQQVVQTPGSLQTHA
jgi:hypothetical protein